MPKKSRRRPQRDGTAKENEFEDTWRFMALGLATTLEESNQYLQQLLEGLEDSRRYKRLQFAYGSRRDELKDKLKKELLCVQFQGTPYFGIYSEAGREQGRRNIRQSADMFWNAFIQASDWGKWSPGRLEVFSRVYKDMLFPNHDGIHLVDRKDKHRLEQLFHNEGELVAIRVVAANFLVNVPLSMMTTEEKIKITNTALMLNPTPEEQVFCTVFVLSEAENVTTGGSFVDRWKSLLEAAKNRSPSFPIPPGSREVYPSEDNFELFRRTSEVGGLQCDYCKKTLKELGVAKLKLCAICQNAFYCGAACQKKAWKEGHKAECRAERCCFPGDFMHLTGCKKNPKLNGRLVKVVKQDVDSGKCSVCLVRENEPGDDSSKLFEVKVKKLLHIRPSA